MDFRPLAHLAVRSLFIALILTVIPRVHAECSDAHMRNLKERGKSVVDIAQQCGMSKADVSAALAAVDKDPETTDEDPEEEHKDAHSRTLPSGSAIQGCGCWGFVPLGVGQRNPVCSSGYEHAVACAGMCPAGGAPWARVCQ